MGERSIDVRVKFGDLDNMLGELDEKGIDEIRVETLWDQKGTNHGLTVIRLYVSVEALLAPNLIASYNKVTFEGLKPFVASELQTLFDKQKQKGKSIMAELCKRGFVVRGGAFEEGDKS